MASRYFTFIGGSDGAWGVASIVPVTGERLSPVAALTVVNQNLTALPPGAAWLLRGVTSHERYVNRREKELLAASQPPLGRPEATCAALIPVKKAENWWQLPQDERREIFEERSSHIATGLKYLPAIARQLHHSYDLNEPFDFLTWFEYAPSHAEAFEELVGMLRETEEWQYVTREIDIRLLRK